MTGCSLPPIDIRCADPAYRAEHPDECANFPILMLQPEYALTEPGKNVTYKVILHANGTQIELTQGLEFTSSNVGVAVIYDNVATGVTPGTTTISVTWQDLSAHAQLEVVASCAETNQHFAVVIDNSKSMGQAFSAAYATKLSFSKQIARDFIASINTSKDDFSVWKFSDSPSRLYDFGTDIPDGQAAVQSIAGGNGKTNITEMLEEVISEFPATGVRVIVLFTDFEWTGEDPHAICQQFKDSGGFLVVVATESWGEFFQDAAECASGGFLLSAYDDTEDSISETLAGLKSFICSAGCAPEPGTAPMAELNYTDFINWNVTQGRVDLVGLGLWDVQPGHGLYVDLQGTGDAGYPNPGQDFGFGQLTSKVDYDFEDGKDYKFSLMVGGSTTAATAGTWTIRIRVGDGVDEEVTITVGNEAFALYEFEWTQVGAFSGPIIIEQTAQSGHHNVGTVIDDILLENLTDVVTMLDDDFDEENPTLIPPSYQPYGCLETPPGSQAASPEPPTPRIVE